MKNTKKFAGAVLAAACLLCGGLAIAGCSPTDKSPTTGDGHVHDYEANWSHDGTEHWLGCKEEGCTQAAGKAEHIFTETNTATCTADGVKKSTCVVCGYEVTVKAEKLGHEWDEGKVTKDATHTAEGEMLYSCIHDGCKETKTEPIEKLKHAYIYNAKDDKVHTGHCFAEGCEEVADVEEEHDFVISSKNKYTKYTCKDCGLELYGYNIKLITKIADRYEAYLDSAVKVGLYVYSNGTPVKVCEEEVNPKTGAAYFLTESGSYQVAIDDPEGYLHNDAPFINVKPDDEYSDPELELVVSKPAEYTFKLFYGAGNDNPAGFIPVTIVPKSAGNTNALPYTTGRTNADGEFKFNLGEDFGAKYSQGVSIKISGYDSAHYFLDAAEIVIGAKTDKTVAVHLLPTYQDYSVKVMTDSGEYLKGIKVRLMSGPELIKEVTMAEDSDVAYFGILPNSLYRIEIELKPEDDEIYRTNLQNVYTGKTAGEQVVELVKKNPRAAITVTGVTDPSGIKFYLTDAEGSNVADGVTDAEGKCFISCPDPDYQYKVSVDKETIPAGYVYYNNSTIAAKADYKTNLKAASIALKELAETDVAVKGADDNSGIKVKLYVGDYLAFEGVTGEDGTLKANLVNSQNYTIVLENLPENMICSTASLSARSGKTNNISIVGSVSYHLTIKDEAGNPLSGATVKIGEIKYSGGKYSYSQKVTGTTNENGYTEIVWQAGATQYYVDVTGEDGKTYYCIETLKGETKGEVVTKELTAYFYDNSIPAAETPAFGLGSLKLADKTTMLNISNKRAEEFSFGGLMTGTYKVTILNPANLTLNVVYKYVTGLEDPWGWGPQPAFGETTEDTDFVKFEKDGAGNIISVTFLYDATNNMTQFRFEISTTGTAISRIGLKIEQPHADFKLTLKDEAGNLLPNAVVQLGYYSLNNRIYTFTEVARGTANAEGLLDLNAVCGTYAVKVTGEDGKIYYTNVSVTCAENGGTVEKELTLSLVDMFIENAGNYTIFIGGDTNNNRNYKTLVDKTTAIHVSSECNATLNCLSTLKAGTYKITLLNPDEDISAEYRLGSLNSEVITENCEYLTFEKDGSGRILSVTVKFEDTDESELYLSINSASEAISTVSVKVENVTE